MSDPLTALMHAVQVMNLLKTLIMKTLREREETDTGSYSPMSSCSSDHLTDGDFDSQQEMESSSELSGPTSDCDENTHNSQNGDETRSLSEIEECFLRQLDEIKTVTSSLVMLDQPTGELDGECRRPQSCSGFNAESGTSFSDSKDVNSGFSLSEGDEVSRKCMISEEEQDIDAESSSTACVNTDEMEVEAKFIEPASASPTPFVASSGSI